jgi:ectoine hydroxylase-related dioxygenase (phytanoyl-CoA dioxygenase family)
VLEPRIGPHPVTALQRDRFRADGFLVYPDPVFEEELEDLRRLCHDFVRNRFGRAPDEAPRDARHDVLYWMKLSPHEREAMSASRVLTTGKDVAAFLLDAPAAELQIGMSIFYKPPEQGLPVLWHQDAAYRDPAYHFESLNMWVPVHNSTADNGCLRFMPGSHRAGVARHECADGDGLGLSLYVPGLDDSAAVSCPMSAGGASFHHCQTLHGSAANRSASPRGAFVFVFSKPPVKRAEPLDWPWYGTLLARAPQSNVTARPGRGGQRA